jgi:hypothetical protein
MQTIHLDISRQSSSESKIPVSGCCRSNCQILLIANIKEILKFVLERSEATLGVTPKMGSISIPNNHLPAT